MENIKLVTARCTPEEYEVIQNIAKIERRSVSSSVSLAALNWYKEKYPDLFNRGDRHDPHQAGK